MSDDREPKYGLCLYCHGRIKLCDGMIPGHPFQARLGGNPRRFSARKCMIGGYPPREVLRALVQIQRLEVIQDERGMS